MKGYKLTKRGENVLLALQIIIIGIIVLIILNLSLKAWDKEYEINSQISTQAAETYYDSLPHK